MKKKLNFEVEKAEIISEEVNSEFATAKITAFSDGVSRHKTICDEETLKRTAPTIYETPIIYEYDSRFSDFGTHSSSPIIAGFVVPNSAEFYKRDDGTQRTSLSITAKIWKRYATQFLEIFKSDNSKKRSVSVEMEVRDAEEEGEHLRLKDWIYTAICVLGEMVTPASPDAELEMMSFAEKSNKEYEEAYKLEFGKYDDLNFKIPQSVKNAAKNGLELRDKYGRGGTSVGLSTARYLVKNDTATPEKVRHVAKYFPRHAGDSLDDKESNGWIAWQLWGGDAGRKWSTSLVRRMNEIDEKKMSYFAEEEVMPYKSMDEVNESIKGIDPPVTLSQANEIAKQADSIGTDDKKNGWAIAISNFKKSHSVEDGKWVKKQNNSEFSEETPPDNYLGMENFSLDSSQIIEIINVCLSEFRYGDNWKKYWAESYDDEYTYVYDNEEDKRYRIPYTLNDKVCVCDMDKKEIVIRGGYEVMAEVENKDEKKFNYAEIFANEDFAKMFAEVEDDEEEGEEREEGEKESYAKAKEEFGVGANPAAVMSAMRYAMKRMAKRYAKMKEKNEVYMSENADMKQKFAEQEEKEKNFAVETFLKELSEKVVVPEDKFAEMKEKSKEFSLSTIDGWKNHCKAFSFDFEKKSTKEEDETGSFFRYALDNKNIEVPQASSVWEKLGSK